MYMRSFPAKVQEIKFQLVMLGKGHRHCSMDLKIIYSYLISMMSWCACLPQCFGEAIPVPLDNASSRISMMAMSGYEVCKLSSSTYPGSFRDVSGVGVGSSVCGSALTECSASEQWCRNLIAHRNAPVSRLE